MDDPRAILTSPAFQARLTAALRRAREELLAARAQAGHWVGELSSSALSTATAVTALAVVDRHSGSARFESAIHAGLEWLARHANSDGGWGDTTQSLSNLSTTTLVWAAFGTAPRAAGEFRRVVARAEQWLRVKVGGVTPPQLSAAILQRYGKDRTFSVPILTMCALAGRLGEGTEAWRDVISLPFELAALPQRWFAALRLPVVSYALPALIAMGQAKHFHRPSRNPFARLLRNLTRARTLRVLEHIQPRNGGFLEATPLTSFVTMSLAGSGLVEHLVTRRGVEFLLASQRTDGSWPIDTNLATWVTTLAINALSPTGFHGSRTGFQPVAGAASPSLGHGQDARGDRLEARPTDHTSIRSWLLSQQYRSRHPYTGAAPGGWAWTDLPGGVPDADDTSGALMALRSFGEADDEVLAAGLAGVTWLLDLQNRDGGMPTFCRGWGTLPFDRSSADITAHALRAWAVWGPDLPAALAERTRRATARALEFLRRTQRPDGSWVPLWFGNQFDVQEENPTYGTSRVLAALATLTSQGIPSSEALRPLIDTATRWLISAQNADGGWGGAPGITSSVEETALALEALATVSDSEPPSLAVAIVCGTKWLIARIESGTWTHPSSIGFYFAKLWYSERLYPMIFTVSALLRVSGRDGASRSFG